VNLFLDTKSMHETQNSVLVLIFRSTFRPTLFWQKSHWKVNAKCISRLRSWNRIYLVWMSLLWLDVNTLTNWSSTCKPGECSHYERRSPPSLKRQVIFFSRSICSYVPEGQNRFSLSLRTRTRLKRGPLVSRKSPGRRVLY